MNAARKLLSLLTAVMLLCSLTPALAETAPEAAPAAPLSAQAYMAGLELLAAHVGGALEWRSEPFPAAPELTAITCVTLDGSPVLITSGDTVVMLAARNACDPAEAQGSFDACMGAILSALLPVLISGGMTREEAIDAILPFINGEEFIPGVLRAMNDEEFWFTFEGHDGLIVLLEDELCLYLYTAPELIPQL